MAHSNYSFSTVQETTEKLDNKNGFCYQYVADVYRVVKLTLTKFNTYMGGTGCRVLLKCEKIDSPIDFKNPEIFDIDIDGNYGWPVDPEFKATPRRS